MTDAAELREQCAALLQGAVGRVSRTSAFVGLDGFVDVITRVVDQRQSAEKYASMKTISDLARLIGGAAGKGTNVELVVERTKIGGNGPIMANALACLGIRVTYVGALGYPNLHSVFHEFAHHAEIYSISEPGLSDALEFNDGKIIFGKLEHLKEITWANIQRRFGRDKFVQKFTTCDLVGLVNWTMLPYMSEVWSALLEEVCPQVTPPRRKMFFDLADPQKRTAADIIRALELITRFERFFDVILGLNEKETYEIGEVLGLTIRRDSREGLANLASEIQPRLNIGTLVVHPVSYALAVSQGIVSISDGPFIPQPKITTGAGDHFNAGFCLGKLLGFDNSYCLLAGVGTSGFYVREARSPAIDDLVDLLRQWPVSQ